MANKIIIKHRSSDAAEPTLDTGEIAANINASGKKLYVGTGSGNVVFPDLTYTDGAYATAAQGALADSALQSETVTSLSLASNILTYTDEDGVDTDLDLSLYLDDTNLARLTSGTVNGTTGVATFTRDDASTFDVDFSALFDDTNLTRITSASFNTGDGVLTLTRSDASTVTVDLDGRYLTTIAANSVGASELKVTGNGTSGQMLSSDGDGTFSWTNVITDLVGDTSPQLGGDLASNGNDILMADNDKIKLGTSGDLEIYHNGTDSIIADAGTGILKYTSVNDTTAGVVFEIENTSTEASSGSFVSFRGSSSTNPAKIGALGNNFYILDSNNNSILSADPQGVTLGYLGQVRMFVNADGIVVVGEVQATGGSSTNWNTAYGWGDHSAAGYLNANSTIDGGTY